MSTTLNTAMLTTIIMLQLSYCIGGTVVISMKVRKDNINSAFMYINFDQTAFQQFYDCLTTNSSLSCAAIFNPDPTVQNQNDNQIVTFTETTESPQTGSFNQYFTCKTNQAMQKTICTRLNVTESTCDSNTLAQAFKFRYKGSNSNLYTCVGIILSWPDEEILYNGTDNFQNCDPYCAYINTHISSSSGTGKTDTIIGIVITLIVLLIVAVIGLVVWRRGVSAKKNESREVICDSLASHDEPVVIDSLPHDDIVNKVGSNPQRNSSQDNYRLDLNNHSRNHVTC